MTSIKGQTTRRCDTTSLTGKVKTLPEQRQRQEVCFVSGPGSPGMTKDYEKKARAVLLAGKGNSKVALRGQNHTKFSQAFTNLSISNTNPGTSFSSHVGLANSITPPMKH